jgi:GTP-binding protein Era
METKAGFVAIIGKPNAGKSTLMNSILGAKLSIVTHKAQTTRKRVIGIYTENNVQIVFTDTPGLIKPKYELQKTMMEYVEDTLKGADVILLVIDATRFDSAEEFFADNTLEALRLAKQPKIAVFNKIDLLKDIHTLLPKIAELANLNIFNEIVPVSAKKSAETDKVIQMLAKYLPEHEYYYDEEYLSTQHERFFVSELIREQIFKFYSEELPYSTEVQITEFKEREVGKWYIAADIVIERDSQKKIIIGEKGQKIKELGSRARRKIENYLDMPVFLELFVKVRPKWRKDRKRLKSFGY